MPALIAWILLSAAAWAQALELEVWHAYRGEERAALEALLAEYDEAHPELVVRPLALPAESFVTKLEAAAPRGNGPDLFVAAHERVGEWSATGLVAPAEGLDTAPYHPTTVEALRYDGALYGVPLAYKCVALFYNRALVQHPAQDSDALLAQLRELTGDGRYGLAYQADAPYFFAPWMHGFGGGIYAGDRVTLDQAGNVAALAFVQRLSVGEGLLPEEPTGALVTQLFNEGQAAYVINGPWFLGEIDPRVDYAVAPLPVMTATGQRAAPFLTVEGAFVSGFAAHPAEARALAEWLASPEPATRRAVEGRQSVATLAALADARVAEDPILSAFQAQLDASVPMPNRPEMAATWEPMARALRRVIRGDMQPAAALAQAQTEFQIVTRPPPEPANPAPYLALLGALVLGGLGWFGRQLTRPGAIAEIKRWGFAYAYVGPAALAMGVLVMLPFIVGAGVSLFAHHQGDFTFVGLANYLDIVLARDWPITSALSFYFTLLVTVLWTLLNVALHVAIGLGLALILREPWVRLRGVWRVALIVPWAVPNYITALIWKGMFHRQFGAINGLLSWLGLEPVSWFGSFSTAFAANLITNTWLGFPFMMVVTLGALQSIPRDLEAAAEVDGATGWQRFWHVTLPLLKPALLPAVVLGSVWTFNMFNIIYLVSGGEPDGATEILISEAYRWAFTRQARYGYAAAYAVLIFFVLLGWSRMGNRIAGRKVL
ncbi:MAG: extracellular solute-binding protein [Alphaproteobacteria bacterium]|nr:extracellular solute-binding protein [Alphaproteobacteria bacterium]